VAGETGHGKTTFLNNAFASFLHGRPVKPHDGSRTSLDDFIADADRLCTKFTVENPHSMERIHYSIQDTPGYGDDTDIQQSIKVWCDTDRGVELGGCLALKDRLLSVFGMGGEQLIVDFVCKKNEQFLELESDDTRMKTVNSEADPRVDVCLYFIAAHRLKLIDIRFMKAISKHVSVIPCIAKADRYDDVGHLYSLPLLKSDH